jgi:1A family penicillin-binding protein
LPSSLSRLLTVVVAAGVLTAVALALLVPQVGALFDAHEAEPVRLDLDPLAQRSIVLASDGTTPLASLHREENRKIVPLEEIPAVLVATVLAVEDQDFYDHGGVDVRAMVRALFKNVESGDVREGGSTITQQLVKNALLDSDQDFGRKIKEAVLSVRLEGQLSKREILERYLNTVYLGNGAYGVQAAAETYFGKDAAALDQHESALLAGMIKNPVGYDPFRFPEEAKARRAVVARRLAVVDAIDDQQAAAIDAAPLPTEPQSVLPKPDDYFVNEVVRRLLDDEVIGKTGDDRYDALFKGGLTITTTLDPKAQQAAQEAVAKTVPDTDGRFTASLISVDVATGAVRALVGGEGFERSKYNIATQGIGRQVGSAFKPFVLAAALDSGISPKSTVNGGGPCKFPNPGGIPDPYVAENFEGSRGGVGDLYLQTKRSANCAYLRLGQIVGLPKVVEMATRLGVTAEMQPNLSLPLGTSEIRPIDMAAAYATIANDGVRNQPYFVEEIRDEDGKVLYRHERAPERAISADVARQTTDILKGVITGGTGTAARFPDRRPAAGKTGTTADHGDAWFVGYTRQLSTAVWMGSPTGNTVKMRNVGGVARVTGGSFPARIWQAFMGPAHAGVAIEDFPAPPPAAKGTTLRLPGEKVTPTRPRPKRAVVTTTTTAESGQTDAGDGSDDDAADRPGKGQRD